MIMADSQLSKTFFFMILPEITFEAVFLWCFYCGGYDRFGSGYDAEEFNV